MGVSSDGDTTTRQPLRSWWGTCVFPIGILDYSMRYLLIQNIKRTNRILDFSVWEISDD